MAKVRRLKYQMLVRVRNFGVATRDAFPETSAAGQLFTQLAALVASIEALFVRREVVKVEARKLDRRTRKDAEAAMKALTSTGRRVVAGEKKPHPFRMPTNRATTAVLTAARLLRDAAAAREEKFLAFGMPPTFLADFDAVIANLATAVEVQQDSHGTRREVDRALVEAFNRGVAIVADLDVMVANTLRPDPARVDRWAGARRIGQVPTSGGHTTEPGAADSSGPPSEPVHVADAPAPATAGPVLKAAS